MVANWLSSFAVVSSFYSLDIAVGLKSTFAIYTVQYIDISLWCADVTS
jgi:hypothetical protein